MTTSATDKTTVTFDLPDYAAKVVTLRLETTVAINSAAEVIAQKDYPVTLDNAGQASSDFPTPDSTGTAAWLYRAILPDGRSQIFTLAYDAASQDIATLLAAAVSTATPSDISALVTGKQAKDADAVSGNAARFDDNGQTVDAGFSFGAVTAAEDHDLLEVMDGDLAATNAPRGYMMQKTAVDAGDSVTIPAGYQMVVAGEFIVDGELVAIGDLVII